MRRRMLTRTLCAVCVAAVAASLTGCGRTYLIEGRVVFLPQFADSQGFIAEVTGQQLPAGGDAVAGATVTMFLQLDEDGRPVRDSVWRTEGVTDADGKFQLSAYANPVKEEKVWLEVSKPGYQTVHFVYTDYAPDEEHSDPQLFIAALAPEKARRP